MFCLLLNFFVCRTREPVPTRTVVKIEKVWIVKIGIKDYNINKYDQPKALAQSCRKFTLKLHTSKVRSRFFSEERVKYNFKMVLTSLCTREILYCWTIKVDIKSPSPKRNHSWSLFPLFIFQSLGTQGTAFKKSYSVECVNALRGHENNIQTLILKWTSS